MSLQFDGLLVGIATFLIIGLFHPIVIKAEYHWGVRCWPLFLVAGLGGVAASLLCASSVASTIFGVFAFSCFWGIGELFAQRKRVAKGWFPKKEKKR